MVHCRPRLKCVLLVAVALRLVVSLATAQEGSVTVYPGSGGWDGAITGISSAGVAGIKDAVDQGTETGGYKSLNNFFNAGNQGATYDDNAFDFGPLQQGGQPLAGDITLDGEAKLLHSDLNLQDAKGLLDKSKTNFGDKLSDVFADQGDFTNVIGKGVLDLDAGNYNYFTLAQGTSNSVFGSLNNAGTASGPITLPFGRIGSFSVSLGDYGGAAICRAMLTGIFYLLAVFYLQTVVRGMAS